MTYYLSVLNAVASSDVPHLFTPDRHPPPPSLHLDIFASSTTTTSRQEDVRYHRSNTEHVTERVAVIEPMTIMKPLPMTRMIITAMTIPVNNTSTDDWMQPQQSDCTVEWLILPHHIADHQFHSTVGSLSPASCSVLPCRQQATLAIILVVLLPIATERQTGQSAGRCIGRPIIRGRDAPTA